MGLFQLFVSMEVIRDCCYFVKSFCESFWYDQELFAYSFLCCVPWFVIGENLYYFCDMIKGTNFRSQSDTKNDAIIDTLKHRQCLLKQISAFLASAAFNTTVIYLSTKRIELIVYGAISVVFWMFIRYFRKL